ncbi:hypothetical protein HK096_008244 [Nowakowskiella sp. JEL0078]|nr:hypothetical protein HK096_008244 [Nowakowskiella sp. JEL0078]
MNKSIVRQSQFSGLRQILKTHSGKLISGEIVSGEIDLSKKSSHNDSNQKFISNKVMPVPSIETSFISSSKINSQDDSDVDLLEKTEAKFLEYRVDVEASELKLTPESVILHLNPFDSTSRERQNSFKRQVLKNFEINNSDKENFDPELGMYEWEKKRLRNNMSKEDVESFIVTVNRIPLTEARSSRLSKNAPKKKVRMPR